MKNGTHQIFQKQRNQPSERHNDEHDHKPWQKFGNHVDHVFVGLLQSSKNHLFHGVTSLICLPSFNQVWLLALEFQTEVFGVRLDILRGRIVMLLQEGINSSAVQRHQCLNQVIAVDGGVMVGSR